MYLDIHNFLGAREWAPVQVDNEIGGVVWAELFVLFDTSGIRTMAGEHVKDPEAEARSEKRRRRNR